MYLNFTPAYCIPALLLVLLPGCDSSTGPADTSPPEIRITSPGATTATVDSPRVTLSGSASDDRGVERLAYQVNGGAEQPLEISPGPTVDFSASVKLPAVTNTIVLTAYDRAGNASTQTVAVGRSGLAFRSVSGRCGLPASGAPYCWGGAYGYVPVDVFQGRLRFRSISSTCGISGSGEVYCWYPHVGGDKLAVLLAHVSAPRPITRLYSAEFEIYALDAEGTPYSWPAPISVPGRSEPTEIRALPVQAAGSLRFLTVSHSDDSACGIATSGATYCWGYFTDAPEISIGAPTLLPGGLAFDSISVGVRAACGLTARGDAYCWGDNRQGQLGNGTTSSGATPLPVSGGLHFRSLSFGYAHVCAITLDDAAYCWGGNGRGELGNGEAGLAGGKLVPTRVAGDHPWESVDAGYLQTCGLSRGGTTYCWGAIGAGVTVRPPSITPFVPTPITGSVVE